MCDRVNRALSCDSLNLFGMDIRPVRTGSHARPARFRLACVEEACGRVFEVTLPDYLAYFGGHERRCNKCGQTIDLWTAAETAVVRRRVDFMTLEMAGAQSTALSLILDPGERATVDLTVLGIPEDARILSISYSMGRGFKVIELPESYQPLRRSVPRRFDVLALPDAQSTAETADTIAMVVWVSGKADLGPYGSLLDAAEHLCSDQLGQVPVLVQVAIETGLRDAVAAEVVSVVPERRSERFARSLGLHDLREVFVPLLSTRYRLPPLPAFLIDRMGELQTARNAAAHSRTAASWEECSQFYLTGAFVLAYVSLMRSVQRGILWRIDDAGDIGHGGAPDHTS